MIWSTSAKIKDVTVTHRSHFDRFCVRIRNSLSLLSAVAVLGAMAQYLGAQDIEPRAYSNIPVGINFLVAGYAYSEGDATFDPSVPITGGKLDIHSAILAYARSLNLWGKSGKFDITLFEAWLSGTATVLGQPRSRTVSGLADPRFRFYVNLFGAPALSLKDFMGYKQDTIIGISLAVTAPVGQYDSQKLVNLGTNRWAFKPELGISKAFGPLTVELATGHTFLPTIINRSEAKTCSKIRFTPCRGTSFTVLAEAFGARLMLPTTSAARRRKTA